MGVNSNIQWTDATWNIARGCTKVDEDCKFCYMYRDSMNGTRYQPLEVVRTKGVFNTPLHLKEPSKIFTCSLTDFFHESIDSYRHEAWDIIRKCPQHTFQILTKRPERVMDHLPNFWPQLKNVWFGTSAGSSGEKAMQRIKDLMLLKYNGFIKTSFLSLEPLHNEIELNTEFDFEGEPYHILSLIDWVIVGGESGNDTGKYRYRQCDLKWIEDIITECKSISCPVFVKQMGTYLAKQMGLKDRHGGNIDEWPEHLRVREFPNVPGI